MLQEVVLDDLIDRISHSPYRDNLCAQVYRTRVDVKIDISTGDVITEHAIQYGHKMYLRIKQFRLWHTPLK